MGCFTTKARGPGRGRTGGSGRPAAGTSHGPSRDGRGSPSPAGLWGQIRVRRGDQLPRRIQRQSPAPGRPHLVLPRPGSRPGPGWIRGVSPGRHGLPACHAGDGTPARYPGHRLPPGDPGTGAGRSGARRRREPGAGGQPGRNTTSPASPTTSVGPSSRENAWRRPERRPGQEIQGAPAQRFRRRGIAASRVTVERRRLPDRGSGRTRPGARIPARTRSTRPGIPAGPVLAVERACAPRGECGRTARADGRGRPRDSRARVPAAGRERPVGRRYGHPDLGGTRRRPTGG